MNYSSCNITPDNYRLFLHTETSPHPFSHTNTKTHMLSLRGAARNFGPLDNSSTAVLTNDYLQSVSCSSAAESFRHKHSVEYKRVLYGDTLIRHKGELTRSE